MRVMSEYMRKYDIYHKYVHENYVGLIKNDKGPFICSNCEYKYSCKKEKLT